MGNLLAVVVHAANIHDTKSGIRAAKLACENYPSIQSFCADAGYRGSFVTETKENLGIPVDISEKIKPHQWEQLPWRWVVERSLGWLNFSRRLSKDFEITVSSEEAFVKISHFHNLLKSLRIQVLISTTLDIFYTISYFHCKHLSVNFTFFISRPDRTNWLYYPNILIHIGIISF